MKYAIIENDLVVNLVRADSPLLSNWVSITGGQDIQINDGYVNNAFIDNHSLVSPIITIDALVNGVTFLSAALNDTVNFIASFSDKTLNITKLEISVVDRLGGLIENLSMNVVNGEGTGSLLVDKPIDYLLTNDGINFHKQAISADLQLSSEIVIRVS